MQFLQQFFELGHIITFILHVRKRGLSDLGESQLVGTLGVEFEPVLHSM